MRPISVDGYVVFRIFIIWAFSSEGNVIGAGVLVVLVRLVLVLVVELVELVELVLLVLLVLVVVLIVLAAAVVLVVVVLLVLLEFPLVTSGALNSMRPLCTAAFQTFWTVCQSHFSLGSGIDISPASFSSRVLSFEE